MKEEGTSAAQVAQQKRKGIAGSGALGLLGPSCLRITLCVRVFVVKVIYVYCRKFEGYRKVKI